MSSTVKDLLKIVKKFKGKWSIDDKVQKLGDEKEVAGLLWEAFNQELMDMEDANYLLHIMHGNPEAWDADGLCRLVHDLQKHFPDGKNDRGSSGWCGDLPGSAWGIRYMIKEKEGDAAFGDAMRTRWKELPTYWGTAIACYLVKGSLIPYTDVPEAYLQQMARLYLNENSSENDLAERNGISKEVWGTMLATVAGSAEDLYIGNTEALNLLLPYASFSQVVKALGFSDLTPEMATLEALDQVGTWSELEKALLATTTDEEPQPRVCLALMFLRRCKAEGKVPSPKVDKALQAMFDHQEVVGYRDSEGIYEALTVLPIPRLEALLTQSTHTQWQLFGRCPTERIAAHIVDLLVNIGDTSDLPYHIEGSWYGDTPEERGGLLYPLYQELFPYAIEALEANPNVVTRRTMYQILSSAENVDKEAAATLLQKGLMDGASEIRDLAAKGLEQLPCDTLAPLLEPALCHKARDIRIAAATLMAKVPPHASIFKLAADRIKKEKSKDTKAVLQSVRPPLELQNDQERMVSALLESEGAAWTDYAKDGTALLDAYWWALAHQFRKGYVEKESPFYIHWLAMLTALAAEHDIQSKAFALYFVCNDSQTYLTDLQALFPTLPDILATMLASPWPSRPAEFGTGYHSEPSSVVSWLTGQAPEIAGPGLIEALGLSDKGIRETAAEALCAASPAIWPWLEQGLAHKQARVRSQVVDLLDKLRLTESLPALQKARKKDKKNDDIKKLIAALKAASLDIDNFAETEEGDKALAKAIAALPQPAATLPDKLPKMRFKSGATMPKKALLWFLSTLQQESQERREPMLPKVRARMDDQDCEKLLGKLDERVPERTRFWRNHAFVSAMLGSAELLALMGKRLDWLVSDAGGKWGRDAMAALAHRGNAPAIRALEYANRRSSSNTIRRRSGDVLETLAAWRNVSLGELLDSAVSDFGFDSSGVQEIDYGGRPMRLQLDTTNGLLVFNEKGKQVKSLPKARKTDDAERVAVIRKEVSEMKKVLRQLNASQKRRLEDSLSGQRTWPTRAWHKQYVEHPIMRTFSAALIWEVLDASGDSVATFAVTEDASLIDLELEEVTLLEGASIRLLHPLNSDPDAIDSWQELLTDQGNTPPFDQLGRRVFRAADFPVEDDALFNALESTVTGPFMGSSQRLGYQQGPREDGGAVFRSIRKMGKYTIIIHHQGYLPMLPDEDVDLQSVEVKLGEKVVPWRELSPVLQSEIVLDLHRLTGTNA